jgi:hypothetical protein
MPKFIFPNKPFSTKLFQLDSLWCGSKVNEKRKWLHQGEDGFEESRESEDKVGGISLELDVYCGMRQNNDNDVRRGGSKMEIAMF